MPLLSAVLYRRGGIARPSTIEVQPLTVTTFRNNLITFLSSIQKISSKTKKVVRTLTLTCRIYILFLPSWLQLPFFWGDWLDFLLHLRNHRAYRDGLQLLNPDAHTILAYAFYSSISASPNTQNFTPSFHLCGRSLTLMEEPQGLLLILIDVVKHPMDSGFTKYNQMKTLPFSACSSYPRISMSLIAKTFYC